ncbi:DUF2500 family protein [Clostridium haemolyticum]|uniref:Uncharacterized protein n=1 Tax=Clostridium haemolyticum NCTC 9693 TaxID=1443114 RepID=A0ABR4TIX8_CLOHA|nr:DUF2500 family protein [Clostridium haemolyticum]KEI18572.1 hypothetical protein Z960_02400 [Clostridium haemolyticum NCTC 9693]KGN00585.1 hypothetical protein Z961_10545 [Clostridium haemolyticum NCTC 8350]
MFQLNIVFYIFVIVVIIMGIVTFIKNERSPIISTKAQLVYKKREYHTHTNNNVVMTTNETLILIFQLDTGSKIEFIVDYDTFTNIPEYQWENLIFEGTRFLKFELNNSIV